MRVYELAKELDISSKELVVFLKNEGSPVSNHMSVLTEKDVELVKKTLGKKTAKSATVKAATEKKSVEKKSTSVKKSASLKKTVVTKKESAKEVKSATEVESVKKTIQKDEAVHTKKQPDETVQKKDVEIATRKVASDQPKQESTSSNQTKGPKIAAPINQHTPVRVPTREPVREEEDLRFLDTSTKQPTSSIGFDRNKGPRGGNTRSTGSQSSRRGGHRRRAARAAHIAAVEQQRKPVTDFTLSKSMPLFEVAQLMGKSDGELILALLKRGMVCNRNNVLSTEVIESLATQFGIQTTVVAPAPDKNVESIQAKIKQTEDGVSRWPVVVVMGHVDHGKTTLLDFIRKMNVAAREKGGITQHISAYEVSSKHGKIVFLDTPGHEAFSHLRQKGARITDIAVLVVAADDGVKPQTVEAIKHARQAGVTIIVAINKMDKVSPTAVETVKRQLAQHELLVEDWGGNIICVPISGKTGQGVAELLEMIVLQSQMMELKAFPDRPAQAFVLESRLEKGFGPVASVICTEGTLKQGDFFVCGDSTGKIRLLVDSNGQKIKEAGPSVPVQVVGFNEFASSGEWLKVVSAQDYARARAGKTIQATMSATAQAMQQELSLSSRETSQRTMNLLIKVDTIGSREALMGLMKKLTELSKEVQCPLNIVHVGIGDISESDVDLAANTHSRIIGFHIKSEKNSQMAAKEQNVDIKLFDVIYHLVEYLQEQLEKKRIIEAVWKQVGEAVVRKVFVTKTGTIAGCYLKEGLCSRDNKFQCVRGGKVVAEGKINSLQRDRKVVKEVHAGYEFAFIADSFNDWQEDDVVLYSAKVKG
ncbi:translation initiation factor IF-2 [Candidatus Babeliales bacterium]|nr:translation initiation factor IF-2 [Candidatus Babeliales bacterium]